MYVESSHHMPDKNFKGCVPYVKDSCRSYGVGIKFHKAEPLFYSLLHGTEKQISMASSLAG